MAIQLAVLDRPGNRQLSATGFRFGVYRSAGRRGGGPRILRVPCLERERDAARAALDSGRGGWLKKPSAEDEALPAGCLRWIARKIYGLSTSGERKSHGSSRQRDGVGLEGRQSARIELER
jgi:hypothetical protein